VTTEEAVTTLPGEAAVARSRAPWLRTALVIVAVLLVVGFLVVTAASGLSADPMAGT
jgi:ABC-type phosphate transport system auxiliary subunit